MASRIVEWNHEAAEQALSVAAMRSLPFFEAVFGDAMPAVAGCLRQLFVGDSDLICGDYSSIEAVGLAELAGCEWRREVFRTHGAIYLAAAEQMFGTTVAEYQAYAKQHGKHHSDRQKGKVMELAGQYGGWIPAVRIAGAKGTDDEIKQLILTWRKATPELEELWGGQPGWRRGEYWGVEGAAVSAVVNPGLPMYPLMRVGVAPAAAGMCHLFDPADDILWVQLPSERWMRYHRPRLAPSTRAYREGTYELSYEQWNTNPKNGPPGWLRKSTYGPKLVENYTQATCRDILRHAIVNLEAAGYPVVQHVYDEIASSVPAGAGNADEFKRIMGALPAWAAHWPVKVGDVWRGHRYRK